MIRIMEKKDEKSFIRLLHKLNSNEYEYEYSYEYLLNNLSKVLNQTVVLSLNNNKIEGFAVIYNDNPYKSLIGDFKEIYVYYYRKQLIKEDLLKYITSNYKDIILITDYYDEIDAKYLTVQSMELNKEGYVRLPGNFNILMDRPSDFLRTKYLDDYYSKFEGFSMDKLEFKYISREELYNSLNDKNSGDYIMPIFEKYGSSGSFFGFRYFTPSDLIQNYYYTDKQDRTKYLCAMYNDFVIGIVKVAYVDEGVKYLCISYIDVHKDFKRRGISKLLVQKLNEYLDNSLILVGTPLSDEGSLCKMDEVFGKYITNTIFIKDRYKFCDYLQNKEVG